MACLLPTEISFFLYGHYLGSVCIFSFVSMLVVVFSLIFEVWGSGMFADLCVMGNTLGF